MVPEIRCYATDKSLQKNWWLTNVSKLALLTLETQKKEIFEENTHFYFNVSIVSEKVISSLNSEYRKIHKATDVLSFPAHEDKEMLTMLKKTKHLELGDIFICLKRLKEQAEEFNHSKEREAAFLFVHGFLHLLGFDHQTVTQERAMFALQDTILLQAGFKR